MYLKEIKKALGKIRFPCVHND